MISSANTGSLLLRTLVVDGDPGFRKTVIDILSRHPATGSFEECGNGLEAIAAVRGFKPDLLICEVEMPGIDGFAVLDAIPHQSRPPIIFVSNYDHFAARAFDVSAVDYVLKPVREERLFRALERARNQIEPVGTSKRGGQHLAIKSGRSVIFVHSDEVDWAEAEGKYVRLHMGKEFLLLKMSISALEAELDPVQFARIHRSTIINVDRVRRLQPWNHRRTYQVTLQDGTRLVLSRKVKLSEISGRTISSFDEAASTL